MDALDLAIVAHLSRDARSGHGEVGARVGLSPSAVQARLDRLAREGVLGGFATLPAPALLGRDEGLLVFAGVDDLEEREADVLGTLCEVPGVAFVDAAADHTVFVWTLHRDEADLERIERAAISLLGKPPAHRAASPRDEGAAALEPRDWRLAEALLGDARASARDLGRATGMSFKTLQRRLGRVLAPGATTIVPILSGTHAAGGVLARTILVLARADAAPTLALAPGALLVRAPGSRFATVESFHATLHDAQRAHARLRRSDGVERAWLVQATRQRFSSWLAEAVAERALAPVASAAAPPVPLPRARHG